MIFPILFPSMAERRAVDWGAPEPPRIRGESTHGAMGSGGGGGGGRGNDNSGGGGAGRGYDGGGGRGYDGRGGGGDGRGAGRDYDGGGGRSRDDRLQSPSSRSLTRNLGGGGGGGRRDSSGGGGGGGRASSCGSSLAQLPGGGWRARAAARDAARAASQPTAPPAGPPSLRLDARIYMTGGITVVPEEALGPLGMVGSVSYTFGFWVTIAPHDWAESPSRDWVPLLHQGNAPKHRCPGLWLQEGDNRLHFRISTSTHWNYGIGTSAAELPEDVPTHVAIVVDASARMMSIYLNGSLDKQKSIALREERRKSPDLGQLQNLLPAAGPLYVGRDPWYAATELTFARLHGWPVALSAADVRADAEAGVGKDGAGEGLPVLRPCECDSNFKVIRRGAAAEGGPAAPGLTAGALAALAGSESDADTLSGALSATTLESAGTGLALRAGMSMAKDDDVSLFSARTSNYTVIPTSHLTARQAQRAIEQRDLQRAVKHGVVHEVHGGRLMFALDDIVYITTADERTGITAWRREIAAVDDEQQDPFDSELVDAAAELVVLVPDEGA